MFIDTIVFALIVIFLVLGVMQGFIVSVLYLSAWVVGIISAWLFSGTFGIMLRTNIEGLAPLVALCLGAFLAFMIPFLLIRIAAAVASFFIKKSSPLTLVNRVLGGVFGALKGAAVAAVILTVVHFLPVQGSLKQARENSFAYSIYKVIPFAGLWKEFKPEQEIKI
jgi:membrane protein required for colicin V production